MIKYCKSNEKIYRYSDLEISGSFASKKQASKEEANKPVITTGHNRDKLLEPNHLNRIAGSRDLCQYHTRTIRPSSYL